MAEELPVFVTYREGACPDRREGQTLGGPRGSFGNRRDQIVMGEKAQLTVSGPVRKGEQLFYECSLCRQRFILPEDREPKEAAAELLAAFKEHVGEQHPDDIAE